MSSNFSWVAPLSPVVVVAVLLAPASSTPVACRWPLGYGQIHTVAPRRRDRELADRARAPRARRPGGPRRPRREKPRPRLTRRIPGPEQSARRRRVMRESPRGGPAPCVTSWRRPSRACRSWSSSSSGRARPRLEPLTAARLASSAAHEVGHLGGLRRLGPGRRSARRPPCARSSRAPSRGTRRGTFSGSTRSRAISIQLLGHLELARGGLEVHSASGSVSSMESCETTSSATDHRLHVISRSSCGGSPRAAPWSAARPWRWPPCPTLHRVERQAVGLRGPRVGGQVVRYGRRRSGRCPRGRRSPRCRWCGFCLRVGASSSSARDATLAVLSSVS
jgi:hypothetical protein